MNRADPSLSHPHLTATTMRATPTMMTAAEISSELVMLSLFSLLDRGVNPTLSDELKGPGVTAAACPRVAYRDSLSDFRFLQAPVCSQPPGGLLLVRVAPNNLFLGGGE